MTQESAARFFKAVKQDQALQQQLKAIAEPDAVLRFAAKQGYQFTQEDLQAAIKQMSPEELAAAINPGVGPRIHLIPR